MGLRLVYRMKWAARILCLLAGMLFAASAFAADPDVTGLVPTIWWDFETKPDAAGLATANKGSASISFSNKGTAAYAAGVTNGWALNTVGFSPYSASDGKYSTAGSAFTVSAVMTLGTNPNGITLNVRCETAQKDLVIRRGSEAGSLVIGLGPQKAASTKFLNATFADGDTAFHLVSVVAEQSGTSLYVDGSLVTNTTECSLWHASGCASRMQFGERLSANQSPEVAYGGLIDDLRIHDAALTSAQMKAIATEYGILIPDGFIGVRASGEPIVGKDSFSVPWSLLVGPDDVADAAIVYGTDSSISSPTTNALGTALSAGDYTASLANLAAGTTYWWKIVASNGVEWAETPVASFRTFDPSDFAKKFTVTVTNGLVNANATLSDFPLLIRLGPGIDGFDYADFSQNGADILVADSNETFLPFELENWDTTGESRLWVQVPSVSIGTELTVYYGTTETVVTPAGMWSGYTGVWHFNETGDGAKTIADSTANELNGTSHASSKARADGILGAARGLELDGQNNSAMTVVPSSSVLDALVPTFTVSGWVRLDPTTLNYGYLFARKTSDKDPSWGWQFRASGNANSVGIYSNGNADDDSQRAIFSTTDKFATNTWAKYAVVYDNTTIYLYLDGVLIDSKAAKPGPAANKSNAFGIGGFPTATNWCTPKADQDEVRLKNGAVSADWIAAEYRQEANVVPLEYGPAVNTDPTSPALSVPVVTRSSGGTFTVTVEVSDNEPTVVFCDADGVTNEMTTVDASLPMTYSSTLSGLAPGTTYACVVGAESSGGTLTTRPYPTAFYNGDLTVTKVSDANEYDLVPGVFRISRADTAHDLAVAYTVGGTAIAGQTYTALSGTATIPAGSLSADIEVVPLLDQDTTADTTVVLTLAAGLYGIDASAGSASLTITNLVAPAGFNTWISPSNSLASIDCNWSSGHSPTASENVLFDGRLSTADCTWDAAASAAVASWTQTNDYTGVITLRTVYPGKGDFQCLTVTGPMAIHSGKITHPQSRTLSDNHNTSWDWLGDLLENETYRLRLDVGSLVVGANGAIDAKGKGYRVTHNSATVNASHGARVSRASQRCYGDPKKPIHIGLADKTQNNGGYYSGKGGGAIYVTSSGPIVVDGAIQADSDRNGTACCGAAGSVYLEAPSVTGTGRISAYGPNSGDGNYKGTGGRVAIVTDEPVDRSTFSAITADSARKSGARYGGAGTVFFKDRTRPNGLLVVGSSTDATTFEWDRIYATASVTTDGDWTFDEVEFGRFGFLVVPVGTTLTLPNGLASCTGVVTSASVMGGIRYEGGTLNIGSGSQTIAGNWMFCAWSNYVFQADVTVKDGAAIGVHPVTGVKDSDSNPDVSARKPPAFLSCRVVVRGDLTVAATGLLRAESCGVFKRDHNNPSQYLGVLGYGTHGGRHHAKGRGDYFCPTNFYYKGYDSVFSPSLPGCSGWYGNGSSDSGGAMSIAVSGHLSLDGVATACGSPATGRADQNNAGGAGGSIDITAGSISGTGTIIANGGSISSTQGGGGRIAIKLTSPGADFSHLVMTNIVASGRTYGDTANERTRSSAGTVYLQAAADGEKGGTVYIAMSEGNRLANNTNTTEMVSLGYGGDDVKDYKKVNYVVSDYGRAAVNTNIVAASVKIADTNSFLDLEGNTLRIKSFMYPKVVNEETVIATLGSGKYTAAELVERGIECVLDSSEGKTGVLDVGGIGFMLYVR